MLLKPGGQHTPSICHMLRVQLQQGMHATPQAKQVARSNKDCHLVYHTAFRHMGACFLDHFVAVEADYTSSWWCAVETQWLNQPTAKWHRLRVKLQERHTASS
jgi:hypothetical protein